MYEKIIATALIVSLTGMNIMPLACQAAPQQKLIKSQVTEYRFDYVNMDWWKKFDDEYLNEYIVKAIENNHDLKVATLQVEQYHQMTKLQLASELPSATVGYAPNLVKMPGSSSTDGSFAFPIIVNYEADIFLKNRDKTRSAKKDWEASKFAERAAYITISSAVGTSYFNIVKLDKLIDVQQEIITSRQTIFDLMKKRNAQGITSTADLVRANKSLVNAQTDLLDLEKSRDTMLNSLAVLIGETPENIAELKRLPYEEVYSIKVPEAIASDVIDQRPDYLKAETMVKKAGIDVRVAKKEFLPSINILGLMMFNSNTFSSTFNWASALGALGGSLMLPVFTGGQRVANLRLRKNMYEQVLQNYMKTNLVAIQEVNDALVSLRRDDEKYKSNLKAMKMEEKDYKYNEHRYNAGVISYLDLLQRKENLLVMNKLVAQNKMDCNIDYIGLYKATGSKL